jgi:multicomponent Na+:H+ antiporter subunit G
MTAWLATACFLAGALFALLAAVGILRLPDVFTRMQASAKASTLGLGCLLLGLAIGQPEFTVIIRALSIAAFLMLTTPVAAHVIARAAALTQAPLCESTVLDERPVAPPDTTDRVEI